MSAGSKLLPSLNGMIQWPLNVLCYLNSEQTTSSLFISYVNRMYLPLFNPEQGITLQKKTMTQQLDSIDTILIQPKRLKRWWLYQYCSTHHFGLNCRKPATLITIVPNLYHSSDGNIFYCNFKWYRVFFITSGRPNSQGNNSRVIESGV